jgi:DNA-binding CsgD family transcriptional regulator
MSNDTSPFPIQLQEAATLALKAAGLLRRAQRTPMPPADPLGAGWADVHAAGVLLTTAGTTLSVLFAHHLMAAMPPGEGRAEPIDLTDLRAAVLAVRHESGAVHHPDLPDTCDSKWTVQAQRVRQAAVERLEDAAEHALAYAETCKPAKQRKRRRSTARKPTPLTPRQIEVTQLMGEHKGNAGAVAKQMGISPQAVRKLYAKGMRKLGRSAKLLAPWTTGLPLDRRGQANVVSPQDDD